MSKRIITVLAAIALASVTSAASAEDFSLHVEGGPALQLRAPNGDIVDHNRFKFGASGEVDGLIALIPNLAVGPTVSAVFLPQSTPNTEGAVMWQFDGTVRLQGARSAGWSPYIQGSLGAAKQAAIWNPGFMTQVGVDFALNQEHSSWLGLYVGWDKVLDTYNAADKQTALLSRQDTSVGTAGVSMSFDFPSKHAKRTLGVITVQEPAPACPPAPAAPVAAPAPAADDGTALLAPSVQFDKDSFVVSADAQAMLTDFASQYNAAPGAKNYMLMVEGYASSECSACEVTHNLVLSNSRANAVADVLVNSGKVDRTMIHPVAFGGVGAPNDASNRRVDTIVIRLVKIQK